jgi:peptide-N4-(N-acetyl-beta-glucosaminyl)asparagine amidase
LKWFKEEFFTWCDKPKCHNCKSNYNVVGINGSESSSNPTSEEREGLAGRVELY